MPQNNERKRGRPRRDNHWIQVFHRWEKSGLSQKEFCEKEGIRPGTFRHVKSRVFDKSKIGEGVAVRQILHSDGTTMLVVSLPSGCQVIMDQDEAFHLRDILARYYTRPPDTTEKDLLDAADLAQQRLNDFRMRKYH